MILKIQFEKLLFDVKTFKILSSKRLQTSVEAFMDLLYFHGCHNFAACPLQRRTVWK